MAIKAAGASAVQAGARDHFEIGKRNYLMLKKILWQNDLLLEAEDIGGDRPRTMYLEVGSGRTWLSRNGQQYPL
jgi:chemotaxis protein CheD